MLFVIIACAITYYLVGFGHADEFKMTEHILPELPLYPEESKKIPKEVLQALEPLKNQEKPLTKEAFIRMLSESVTAAQWASHGDTIIKYAAPTPIPPPLQVLFVLLFALVVMVGPHAVAWSCIRLNTFANCRTAFASTTV